LSAANSPEFTGTLDVKQAGFSIRLLDTGSKSDEKGRPLDYYSRVEVLEGGRRIFEKTLRVNDPLEYKGVKFYQSNYGVLGFNLDVKNPAGRLTTMPIKLTPEGVPDVAGPEQVEGTNLFVFLHNFYPDMAEKDGKVTNLSMNYDHPAAQVFIYENFSMDHGNQYKAKGWVSSGNPLKYKNYTVSMGDLVNYTGLQYRKDPGIQVVWTGFMITILGLFMSFYLTNKTMRLLLKKDGKSTAAYLLTYSSLQEGFEREIESIKKALKGN
jgi:cytochrome c biogenesis protein